MQGGAVITGTYPTNMILVIHIWIVAKAKKPSKTRG
jgi:hypothetical protein